jgi:hypothetical protein
VVGIGPVEIHEYNTTGLNETKISILVGTSFGDRNKKKKKTTKSV